MVNTHPWSVDALLAKARLSLDRMKLGDANSSENALWSAITLELLARAALSNFSPVLLADEKNWRNLSFALGKSATSKRFNPSSIGIKEVLSRLSELDPKFTQEIINFCSSHFDKRNAEVHTGELAFLGYGTSVWLPKFYQASEVFLVSLGIKIEDFFSDPEHVRTLIDSLNDQAAQSVRGEIDAYKKVWEGMPEPEKALKINQAEIWASRHNGHRVTCPACSSPALVHGTATGPVQTQINEDEIEQKQARIPSSFECVACGLRISGFSKLAACHLGNTFTETTRVAASEFFGLFTEDEVESAVIQAEQELHRSLFAPDFND